MNKVFYSLILIAILSACKSPVEKLLRSNDVELKERKAQEYFEKCDFASASPLFKDLIQSFNTVSKVEKVYFYYSFCDYKLQDYLLAAYEFKKIIQKFPKGAYVERAQFLLADCYFQSTPIYSLDQEYNLQAVEEFQVFLEKYPKSEKADLAIEKINQLHGRRERKAFENGKLYFNTEDYKSSIHSLSQVLQDYPETEKGEELQYLIVESAYRYAEQSIEAKQAERFLNVQQYVRDFDKNYGDQIDSKYYKLVRKREKNAKSKAKSLEYSLPLFYFKRERYAKATPLWKKLIAVEKEVEQKRKMSNYLLQAYYDQALSVSDRDKVEKVNLFVTEFDSYVGKLSQEDAEKWRSKHTYMNKLSKNLPNSLPYEFLEAGDYKNSNEYFNAINDTLDFSKKYSHKQLYYSMVAKHKRASRINEVPAFDLWTSAIRLVEKSDSWKEGRYKGEISSILSKTQRELDKYPLKLVEEPMRKKNYAVAVSRAEDVIKKEKTTKDREEVVYLLILSSVKRAKSVKKYERLPQYKLAESKYKEYVGLVTDVKIKQRIEKLKVKIDKGLTKYLN